MKSFDELNEIHIDLLREIGNIGSASAATSLSKILERKVNIAIPDIGIADYSDAYDKLGGVETVMVGTLLTLSGELSGMMLFLLPDEVACNLINLLMFTELNNYSEIDEMGFSAVGEMANIMSAAFVMAITDMTGLRIEISPPESTVDMLGAIMSVPAVFFAQMGDKLMYIKNDLEISGKRTPANIMLLPDLESLKTLIASLGIEA